MIKDRTLTIIYSRSGYMIENDLSIWVNERIILKPSILDALLRAL